MRAFTSEWVKLSRRSTLVGFGGSMVGFTLLFTILAFESAGGRNIDLDATTAMLSTPEGSVFVVTDMAAFRRPAPYLAIRTALDDRAVRRGRPISGFAAKRLEYRARPLRRGRRVALRGGRLPKVRRGGGLVGRAGIEPAQAGGAA
jgi:hypothetical protein